MKKQIIYAVLVLLITPIIAIVKGNDSPPVISSAHALAPAAQNADTDTKPVETPAPAQTAQNAQSEQVAAPQPVAPSKPTTCREAIAAVIPAHLQSGFITVMTHENRSELVDAEGAINPDAHSSKDWGCFQINDYWHPDYFSGGDWRDPVWAAQYALKIYEGRKAKDGIGWTAWYAVEGILW